MYALNKDMVGCIVKIMGFFMGDLFLFSRFLGCNSYKKRKLLYKNGVEMICLVVV